MTDKQSRNYLDAKKMRQVQDAVLAASQDGYFNKRPKKSDACTFFSQLLGFAVTESNLRNAAEVMEVELDFQKAPRRSKQADNNDIRILASFLHTLATELGKEAPADIVRLAGGPFLNSDGTES